MCTRLHAIGFPCEMDRRTAEFIGTAALNAKRRIACAEGEYRIWRSPAGAEIWLHYPSRDRPFSRTGGSAGTPSGFDPIGDLMGMTVVHAGASVMRMRLARVLRVSKDNPLDGTCVAMLGSQRSSDKPIAFTFELVGYAETRHATGAEARVRVTALAQWVWAFAREDAYLAATPSHRLIGKGAMAQAEPGMLPDAPLIYRPKPGTLWLVTGEVRRSVRLVNPVTRAPYYWVLLATDRGDIDLVASPDRIEGDVSDGHTLQAVVTTAGRIIEELH
ncbi:MAG: hypothetical protein SFW09_19115 [Hyphomicrobiaceae bacterium]|nr:hypothetical protein [Hyphomicrobiaceae bacterium]